jgi:hypothetical protein
LLICVSSWRRTAFKLVLRKILQQASNTQDLM